MGDSNHNIVQYNLFDFIEEVYDYISFNDKYKASKIDIALHIKTKTGMEIVHIMYSYSFSKDTLNKQLGFLDESIRSKGIYYTQIKQVYLTLGCYD